MPPDEQQVRLSHIEGNSRSSGSAGVGNRSGLGSCFISGGVASSSSSSSSLDHIGRQRKHSYYVNKAANCRKSSKRSLSIADLGWPTTTELPMQTNTRLCDDDDGDDDDDDDDDGDDDGGGGGGGDDDVSQVANKAPPAEDKPTRAESSSANQKTEGKSASDKNNHHLATARRGKSAVELEEECDFTAGENSRCNCSGRRRSTLAGLIELFEQRVQLAGGSTTTTTLRSQQAKATTIQRAAERGEIAKTTNNSNNNNSNNNNNNNNNHGGTRNCSARSISCKANKINNESAAASTSESYDKNMRDIITPVSYDHQSSTSDGDSITEHQQQLDSLEEPEPAAASRISPITTSTIKHQSRHHRISTKGVPVLPQHQLSKRPTIRRLTKTNWQPPTDARKYDRLLVPTSSDHCLPPSTHKGNRAGPNPAHLSPSIVKHQPSSSRRLLNQLARARKQTKPSYQVRRPEKVAQVEALIEQLEQATAQWDEDESLLERAERRDWPAEYYKRYGSTSSPAGAASSGQEKGMRRLDFGRRPDVPSSIEEKSVARSHRSQMMNQDKDLDPDLAGFAGQAELGTVSSKSTSTRRTRPRYSHLPSAFADRYYDDLAVRRLSRTSQPDNRSAQTTMSYLLCSNAYTPSSGSRSTQHTPDLYDSLERRVRLDDLQYRQYRAKNRLDPHEPPFGIPRQAASASVHSSASHYLRQQPSKCEPQPAPTCHCLTASIVPDALRLPSNKQPPDQRGTKRTDSRVSFVDDRAGGASADSGLAGGSPAFSEATRSSRLATPIKVTDELLDDDDDDADVAEEINLDELLCNSADRYLEDGDPSRCESPAVERYKAELAVMPARRRPKINIGRPGAKSPLLRISRRPPIVRADMNADADDGDRVGAKKQAPTERSHMTTTPVEIRCYESAHSEIECRYDFTDDDDEGNYDDDDNQRELIQNNKPLEINTKPKYITNSPDEEGNNLCASGQSPNESSLERLNYRGEPIKKTPSNATNTRINGGEVSRKKCGPIFSIGQYKPLNKPHLKIL